LIFIQHPAGEWLRSFEYLNDSSSGLHLPAFSLYLFVE